MSSQIKSVLTTIAAWTPTFDSDVTVRCDNVSTHYQTHGVPFRKLTVIPGPDESGAMVFIGKTINITWELHDVFYYKPVGSGDGKKTADEVMVDYIVSYVNAARNGYALTSQTVLKNVNCTPGVYAWGDESWFGVDCELTIQETYGGA